VAGGGHTGGRVKSGISWKRTSSADKMEVRRGYSTRGKEEETETRGSLWIGGRFSFAVVRAYVNVDR